MSKLKDMWSVLTKDIVVVSGEQHKLFVQREQEAEKYKIKADKLDKLNRVGISLYDLKWNPMIKWNSELKEFMNNVAYDMYPSFIRFYFKAHYDKFRELEHNSLKEMQEAEETR